MDGFLSISSVFSSSPALAGGLGSLLIWILLHRIFKSKPHAGLPTISNTTNNAGEDPKLPEWYWSDPKGFQLERRAIFSKNWICVSHTGRFVNSGDYVSYDVSGYQFFLILGKDGVVRAFHNVCRHRAFPVTKKVSGSSTVLSCQYHGWSYNTKGELIKAPQFDAIKGFNKAENSLFAIRTRIDRHGFIHINLGGSNQSDNGQSLITKSASHVSISSNSQYLLTLEYEAKFNWKLAEDASFDDESLQTEANFLQKIFSPLFNSTLRAIPQLQYFPLTTVYTEPNTDFWYQVTHYPDSAQQTRIRCDVYTNRDGQTALFDEGMKTRLDSYLKTKIKQQEMAFARVATVHPEPSSTQQNQSLIADLVKSHLNAEKMEGREIKPATVQQCKSANFMKAEGICQAMECTNSDLDW